jgi:hypothetical protein
MEPAKREVLDRCWKKSFRWDRREDVAEGELVVDEG